MVNTRLRRPKGPSLFYYINTADLPRGDYYAELANDYGDIVKMPTLKRCYLVNAPHLIQHILINNSLNYAKGGMSFKAVEKTLGFGLVTVQHEVWTERRKMQNNNFTQAKIVEQHETIVEITKRIIKRWDTLYCMDGKPFNIAHEMMLIVLTIACKVLFNYDIAIDEAEEFLVAATLHQRVSCGFATYLPGVPFPKKRKYKKALALLNEFCEMLFHRYEQNPDESSDVLQSLGKAFQEKKLSKADVLDEIKTLLATGHETTGASLAWTWHLLGQNPACYEKLRSETKSVLGEKSASKDDYAKLIYTKMVFEESLRLYPPIWLMLRKALADDTYDDFHIDKNSEILISSYAVHRYEKFWENPLEFNPERFNKTNRNRIHKYSYLPFGFGPRTCIAINMAMYMGILITATISQHYLIKPAEVKPIEMEFLISLRPKNGVWATVEKISA